MNFLRNIINWIRSHKLISFGILIVFIIFAIVLLYSKNKTNTTSPSSTPFSRFLQFPSVEPSSGSVSMAGTQTSISLFFETPVNLSTVSVDSNPKLTFKISTLPDFPNRVILTPQSPWREGTKYTIRISKGVRSSTVDKELGQDIVIDYDIQPIPTPKFLE